MPAIAVGHFYDISSRREDEAEVFSGIGVFTFDDVGGDCFRVGVFARPVSQQHDGIAEAAGGIGVGCGSGVGGGGFG